MKDAISQALLQLMTIHGSKKGKEPKLSPSRRDELQEMSKCIEVEMSGFHEQVVARWG